MREGGHDPAFDKLSPFGTRVTEKMMKAIEILKNEYKFTDSGIEKLISTIESVLPRTPDDWESLSSEAKLDFIYKNKVEIDECIQNSKPEFTDKECDAFNWFNSTDEEKIKRLKELQSASVILRMFSLEN